MKYTMLIFPLLITTTAYSTDHYQKNTIPLSETRKKGEQCIQLQSTIKPAIATTSMGMGTYLLYDALKTAVDMQGTSQQNSEKGIAINAVIGAGLFWCGYYLFQQIREENKKELE